MKGNIERMKKSVKPKGQSFTEFIDTEGKKWVQTSTEDLFSIKEINDIIGKIEKKEDEAEDIILARIDFKQVNKDYYEKTIELQERLKKKNEMLKNLVEEARTVISKKNLMLRELIDYVKKLHLIFAYYNINPRNVEKVDIPPEMMEGILRTKEEAPREFEEEQIEYTEVEEILLDDEGNEAGPVS
ncbi:MAG TPA: hypothetical protein PK253_10475 [Spirochaetota bacterium]|nr:hypothetical protein [Spirochaetota bacterium]